MDGGRLRTGPRAALGRFAAPALVILVLASLLPCRSGSKRPARS